MTDAFDRPDAPSAPFAFSLPPAVSPRDAASGVASGVASGGSARDAPGGAAGDAPRGPASMGSTPRATPPEELIALRRTPQRHGSAAGRLIGPVLILGMVASLGVGGWKLFQTVQRESATSETDAPTTTLDPAAAAGLAGPATETTVPVDPMTGDPVGEPTPYPGTGVVVPSFRTVTVVESAVESDDAGSMVASGVQFRLDLVDQIGDLRDVADGASGAVLLLDPAYTYQPGAAFGAPWTRRPAPVNWFDATVVSGLDTLVAELGVAGVIPTATSERVGEHDVTTYRSVVTLSGPALALLTGVDAIVGPGGSLAGVHLAISADAAGVVIALELDARDAITTALAGSPLPGDVTIWYRHEVIGWGDEPLGLSLPTDWVDA